MPVFPSPPTPWSRMTSPMAQFHMLPWSGLDAVGILLSLKCPPIYFLIWGKKVKKWEKGDYFYFPLHPTSRIAKGVQNHSGNDPCKAATWSTTWYGPKVYPVLKYVSGGSRMLLPMVRWDPAPRHLTENRMMGFLPSEKDCKNPATGARVTYPSSPWVHQKAIDFYPRLLRFYWEEGMGNAHV